MPELPEVETIVRELLPRLRGRHIVSAEILHPRIVRHSGADLAQVLPGSRILDVVRHGKFVLVQASSGWLTIHLGMTGQMLFDADPSPYTRAVLQLDDAVLLYDDIRMFGSIEWGRQRVDRLGPDALGPEAWERRLTGRKAPIKAVLLNQQIVAGIGNIYADEALFRAGVHPATRSSRIGTARASRLAEVTRALLQEAVEHRGSSISDYVDTEGRRGSFQDRHQVYGREGQPCLRCGLPIRKTVVAQRGTHYCPACQKR